MGNRGNWGNQTRRRWNLELSKASKSLQSPGTAPAPGSLVIGASEFWAKGRRSAAPPPRRLRSPAALTDDGAAIEAPPPPLRVVSLKGDQLMENE